jgi:hypothetical protein
MIPNRSGGMNPSRSGDLNPESFGRDEPSVVFPFGWQICILVLCCIAVPFYIAVLFYIKHYICSLVLPDGANRTFCIFVNTKKAGNFLQSRLSSSSLFCYITFNFLQRGQTM